MYDLYLGEIIIIGGIILFTLGLMRIVGMIARYSPWLFR